MSTNLHMLDEPDVCSLLFLILLLAFIGSKLVERRPVAHRIGLAVAFSGGLLYGLTGIARFEPADAEQWVFLVIRALLAGLVLLGPAWIVLGVLDILRRCLIEIPARAAGRTAEVLRRRQEAARDRLLAARQADRAREQDAERRAREAEQAASLATEQARRCRARANAELSYSLFAPKVGDRFPREQFDRFVSTFMGDDQAPDVVEAREQELLATLHRHAEAAESPRRAESLEDLAAWFARKSEEIEHLPLSDRDKRNLLAQLRALRYSQLTQLAMERIEP